MMGRGVGADGERRGGGGGGGRVEKTGAGRKPQMTRSTKIQILKPENPVVTGVLLGKQMCHSYIVFIVTGCFVNKCRAIQWVMIIIIIIIVIIICYLVLQLNNMKKWWTFCWFVDMERTTQE